MSHPTRLFETPEQLWDAWERYKEALKEEGQKWQKVQYVGRDGDRVADAQKVPLTYEGFKRFCRAEYGNVHQYFDNKDGYYNEFVDVCSHVKNEIREDQIVGGLLGFYNPSITQRLNNLVDRSETTISEQPLFGDDK